MRTLVVTLAAALLLAGAAHAVPVTETFTATPDLAIPDATAFEPGAAVTSTMVIDRPYVTFGIRVYMHLTTSASSDLRIWVESPYGTRLELMHLGEGGVPAVDPAGWFPTDFAPYEDMSVWLGEGMSGTWTIICQDWSQGTLATLDEWRLELSYDDVIAVEPTTWGGIKALFE